MGRLSGVLTVINIVLYLFLLFLGDGSRTAFAMLAVEFVVGFDDTLDEFMADNVLFSNSTLPIPFTPFRICMACTRPEVAVGGRSICVTSPVMIILHSFRGG